MRKTYRARYCNTVSAPLPYGLQKVFQPLIHVCAGNDAKTSGLRFCSASPKRRRIILLSALTETRKSVSLESRQYSPSSLIPPAVTSKWTWG